MTFAAILSAALWLCLAVPDDHATLVITGARVWTGNPGQPWADAVAVRDDRVLA